MPILRDPVDLRLDAFNGYRRVVFFPGSTIGNLKVPEARALLRRMANIVRPDGAVLLGVDLKKDVATLEKAYDDSEGVTAEFNMNLLHRLNRELGADFDLEQFEHQAVYNGEKGRVEMHLVSQEEQTVEIEGTAIGFDEGESILTECSYKYTPDEFARLARDAGLEVQQKWIDDQDLFSIQYLTPS